MLIALFGMGLLHSSRHVGIRRDLFLSCAARSSENSVPKASFSYSTPRITTQKATAVSCDVVADESAVCEQQPLQSKNRVSAFPRATTSGEFCSHDLAQDKGRASSTSSLPMWSAPRDMERIATASDFTVQRRPTALQSEQDKYNPTIQPGPHGHVSLSTETFNVVAPPEDRHECRAIIDKD